MLMDDAAAYAYYLRHDATTRAYMCAVREMRSLHAGCAKMPAMPRCRDVSRAPPDDAHAARVIFHITMAPCVSHCKESSCREARAAKERAVHAAEHTLLLISIPCRFDI